LKAVSSRINDRDERVTARNAPDTRFSVSNGSTAWLRLAVMALIACTPVVVLGVLLSAGSGTWRYSLVGGASRDATIPIGGYAFVSVPRGALARDARISIERSSQPCSPSPGPCPVLSLGDPFRVQIGAPLLSPALVAARYDAVTLSREHGYATAVLAFFDEGEQRWVPVTTKVDRRRRYVTTLTSRDRPTVWMPIATP
jgi:hypothetical protein